VPVILEKEKKYLNATKCTSYWVIKAMFLTGFLTQRYILTK